MPGIAVPLWWRHAPLAERLRSNTGWKLCPAWILATWMWWAVSLTRRVERGCGILGRKVVTGHEGVHAGNTPRWLWWSTQHWRLVPQVQQLLRYGRLQLLMSSKQTTQHNRLHSFHRFQGSNKYNSIFTINDNNIFKCFTNKCSLNFLHDTR